MFAVKGWNLGALKTQTDIPKTAKPEGDNAGQSSKKRKRDRSSNVTGANVAKLWDRHVVGKEVRHGTEKTGDTSVSQKNPTVSSNGDKPSHKSKKHKRQRIDGNAGSKTETGHGVRRKAADGNHKNQTGEAPQRLQEHSHEKPNAVKGKEHKKPTRTDNNTPMELDQNALESTRQSASSAVPLVQTSLPSTAKLTPMQSAMRQKLISARFRHLNQTLYTEDSSKALKLFGENPDMFNDYHAGFRQQVEVWPENPLDNFVHEIRRRGKLRQPFKDKRSRGGQRERSRSGDGADALPRTHGTAIIADLGCGDARLAHTLISSGDAEKLNLKLSSFDLGSNSPLVTRADISNLPVDDGIVDVAIFCLALMGTNWISFIEEAYRILHWKGELWIAEIKSRFGRVTGKGRPVEHSVGGKKKQVAAAKASAKKQAEVDERTEQQVLAVEVDGVDSQKQETDVSAFVDVLRRRGFVLKEGERGVDLSNKMFVKMEFVKAAAPTKGKGLSEVDDALKNRQVSKGQKLKFLDEVADELNTEDEAKVLKPCLYKIR